MINALKSIEIHESFEPKPYIDPLAHEKIPADEFAIIKKNWHLLVPTFGFGFTYITQKEAEIILQGRINQITTDLHMQEWSFRDLPRSIKNVLVEMGFQLGLEGVIGFKKMWIAFEHDNYKEAAAEMRNSLWYKQTTNRAEELARIVEQA